MQRYQYEVIKESIKIATEEVGRIQRIDDMRNVELDELIKMTQKLLQELNLVEITKAK